MATGFKIDKKTGEPLHLVFSGEATVDDYITDDDGNVTIVQTIVPSPAPADDEWFPDDFDAVLAELTKAGDRMPLGELMEKFAAKKPNKKSK